MASLRSASWTPYPGWGRSAAQQVGQHTSFDRAITSKSRSTLVAPPLRLRKTLESLFLKVVVENESYLDSQPPHDLKADTIHQTELFARRRKDTGDIPT